MKKVLSTIMAMAMLVSCFAFSTSAIAAEIPSITAGGASVSVTFPKNGSDENSVKVAKFVPEETGWYEFECDALYTSTTSKKDELPGGVFAVDLYEENYFATQGMCFFADTSKLTEEQKAMYKEAGMSLDDMNRLITTALCEKGKTYYVTGYQDGTADYTANLTVKTHTHTIKADNEDKVKVNKDGTSNDAGGKYETCTCGYCNYMEYTENYYQIVRTTVKNAVYTGKVVKPAVKIETATGKKLASKYYTLTYKNNKKIGKGTVIIKFQNGYTGTVKKTFKINPKATSLKKVSAGTASVKASYKKVAKVSGYEVQAATNKTFKRNKKSVVSKKTSATVEGLKSGKKYFVRVRAFKTVKGKKYYSAWSKAKTVTVK